jgi:hypothetical protein
MSYLLYREAVAVVPSDSGAITASALYVGGGVGGAGNIQVDVLNGHTAVLFMAVPVGTVLPVTVSRVYATNTTATNILALRV